MNKSSLLSQQCDDFYKDGVLIIPDFIKQDQVAAMMLAIDALFDCTKDSHSTNRWNDYVLLRCFELDRLFFDLISDTRLLDLVEAIISPDCHLIADCALRQHQGEGISNWHSDDEVLIPFQELSKDENLMKHLPVLQLNVMFPLTPMCQTSSGPTQVVPGSHLSGKKPDEEHLVFRNRGVESIFCRPGDIYLFNGQTWHRGAPITEGGTRYLYSLTFSPRWVSQRFYPFVDYHLPNYILDCGDPRLLRVMGKHGHGAFG